MTRLGTKALRLLPPEAAHRATIHALRLGLGPKQRPSQRLEDDRLQCLRFGLTFDNPLGIAAGFDKHAEAIHGLDKLGLGLIEIGSVTPNPQPGNAKPRVFRLGDEKAIINRNGFNSHGLETVNQRLEMIDRPRAVLGVNLGKNKDTPHAVKDYVAGAKGLAHHADYLVANVSSPNTQGLRAEQDPDRLAPLLSAVKAVAPETPLLVKLAPDLADNQVTEIAEVLKSGICDGAIVSNTTIDRPADLNHRHASEQGGLSGPPLFERSTKLLGDIYKGTGGTLPLVGVGGIDSAQTAIAKIRAGASLLQLYTALVYHGPGLIMEILKGLSAELDRLNLSHIDQLVGADHDA